MIALGVADPNNASPGWDREIVVVGYPTFAQGFTSVLNIAFAYAGNQVSEEMKEMKIAKLT